ncbi:short chain dehydrogenase [Natronorubrum thiooxidans]|uniref:Short chain dehydrogenase n=1 Tax=Natronorubrum thiooxidans TaxID=308853 RepID=A0A1N7FDB0_9EURY|nr:short chain dehydrogenase [Natronorubrum thiooxidans]
MPMVADMTASPLERRTAIVTGASTGIGAATCRGLAAEGATVVLAATREGSSVSEIDVNRRDKFADTF